MQNDNERLFGKYIPIALTISDFALVNLVFYITTILLPYFYVANYWGTIWLLVNVAWIPCAIRTLRRGISQRAIALDITTLNALKMVGIHALFFMSMMNFMKTRINWEIYATFYAVMMVAMPLWYVISRRIIKHLRSRGRNSVRIVIVGTNQTALRLAQEMRSDQGFGYRIMGFFDDERPQNFPEKYLGPISELEKFVHENKVQEIYFTLAGEKHEALSRVVKIADDAIIPFYYVPQISKYVRRNFSILNLGAMPVLSLMRNPLKSPLNSMIKRGFDIAFSTTFLIFSPIVFIPVAIGIKLTSPGPIFFRQERTGHQGQTFQCLKFRTMRVNDQADSAQATEHDPRKTKFGDFLRRTSIDELPQFINVWLGDMSVVGPRPHMLKHTEEYTQLIDKYMVRHVVKPGITGWAQVNGYRGITDQVWKMEKRVEFDVWYIEHWNFFLDLKIIVRTVINALGHDKNAF